MLPIHLDLGFKTMYNYEGFYFAIAIITGVILFKRRLLKYKLYNNHFDSLMLISITGALLGGRFFHVIFWDFSSFLENPLSLLYFWEGGISITGGIFGGILTGIIFSHCKQIPFYKWYTLAAPAFLLSQAIGRLGCFLNGDAFGTASNLPWAVSFPKYGYTLPWFKLNSNVISYPWEWAFSQNLVSANSTETVPLHPAQLYEAFGDIIIMVLILLATRYLIANKHLAKTAIFIHTGLYSLLRFFIEFIRADRVLLESSNISSLQITLLGWSICSLLIIIFFLFKYIVDKKE